MHLFISAGQSIVSVNCAPYVEFVVHLVDELHILLLNVVPPRYLAKKKDHPPLSIQIFGIDIQFQLSSIDCVRSIISKKDRPPWLRNCTLSRQSRVLLAGRNDGILEGYYYI